jgi:hypothetical protein
MATLQCQRCGFVAKTEARLVKHWKTELQCPALYDKTKHQELIEQLRPAPSQEARTCPRCQKQLKSVSGMKIHHKKCLQNAVVICPAENQASTSSDNVTNTALGVEKPQSVADLKKRKKVNSPYSSVSTHNQLLAFDKEIDWHVLGITQKQVLELCRKKEEGIIDLFIMLHNCERHENIQWFYDEATEQHKLIVYDGKKWIDINQKVITQHLWYIFSFLEEQWCDYQSAIRCDALEPHDIISETEQAEIEEFFYETIVDEESVFFHCKDMFNEYTEAIKTI